MEKALFSIMLSLPLIRHYFLSYKHIFYSLHSDHSPSGQFGYVADAVPLLRKCYHIPILFPQFSTEVHR